MNILRKHKLKMLRQLNGQGRENDRTRDKPVTLRENAAGTDRAKLYGMTYTYIPTLRKQSVYIGSPRPARVTKPDPVLKKAKIIVDRANK